MMHSCSSEEKAEKMEQEENEDSIWEMTEQMRRNNLRITRILGEECEGVNSRQKK